MPKLEREERVGEKREGGGVRQCSSSLHLPIFPAVVHLSLRSEVLFSGPHPTGLGGEFVCGSSPAGLEGERPPLASLGNLVL